MATALKKGLISEPLSWTLNQLARFRNRTVPAGRKRGRSMVMKTHCRFCFFALALGVLSLPAMTMAAENVRVGVAATVKEDVTGVIGSEAPRRIIEGEDVFFDESVITTTSSSAVVRFRDRSTLEIGPDSTVIIDRSVFNPAESVSEKSITVVSAVFRFVSGVATKTSETDIRTPSGVMGIRGTVALGKIAENGDGLVFLAHGQADWTSTAGTTNVPPGSAVLVVHATGQTLITDPVRQPFASIIREIMVQLGPKPPQLQNFTAAQMAQNAEDHQVPAARQNQLQPGSPKIAIVQPKSTPGQPSEIANLLSIIQSGQGRAALSADMNYIHSVLDAQAKLNGTYERAGVVQVTQELSTVMSSEEASRIARELSALDPEHATEILADLDSLGFTVLAFAPPAGNTPYGGNIFGNFGSSTSTGAGSSVSK